MRDPSVLSPVALQDDRVVLEPLGIGHIESLERAAALAAQAQGDSLPFAVRDRRDGAVVGSTRLFDFEQELPRIEIGYTWYAASRQRSCVNTACKRLLLAHAFETLKCVAVQFSTDRYNHASQ